MWISKLWVNWFLHNLVANKFKFWTIVSHPRCHLIMLFKKWEPPRRKMSRGWPSCFSLRVKSTKSLSHTDQWTQPRKVSFKMPVTLRPKLSRTIEISWIPRVLRCINSSNWKERPRKSYQSLRIGFRISRCRNWGSRREMKYSRRSCRILSYSGRRLRRKKKSRK